MKSWLTVLISILIVISFAYATADGNLKSNEKNSGKASCEQAMEVMRSDVKPIIEYADNLYNNCDCLGKEDPPKGRQCYDKVVTSCDKILEKDQSQIDALDLKATAMDRINEIDGKTYQASTGQSCTCIKNSSYRSVIAGYDRALELNSSNAMAWNNRGILLGELCCLNESVSSFDEALAINSSLAEPWYNKGVSLYYYSPKEALNCFNRSVELEPNLAEGWFNRCALLIPELVDFSDPASEHAYNEAKDSYNKSLILKPVLGDYSLPYLIYIKI
jgi:tetratricopeptide (TPR) repeat protein